MPDIARGHDLRSVAAVFAPLGWRAIGGPAVHVALMEREVVGRRRWLDRAESSRLYAACNLLPGPVFAVAAFLGVQMSGIPGGVVAALAIFAPSLVFVPLVNVVVRVTEARPGIRAALDGVVVAAVGLIASACVALARVAFGGPIEVLTAVAVFALLWRWPRGQPIGLALGVLAGLLVMATTR